MIGVRSGVEVVGLEIDFSCPMLNRSAGNRGIGEIEVSSDRRVRSRVALGAQWDLGCRHGMKERMADDDGNIKEDMRRWKHEGHPTGMWHAAKAIYSYLHILARAAQRSSPLDQIGPTEPPAGQGSRG